MSFFRGDPVPGATKICDVFPQDTIDVNLQVAANQNELLSIDGNYLMAFGIYFWAATIVEVSGKATFACDNSHFGTSATGGHFCYLQKLPVAMIDPVGSWQLVASTGGSSSTSIDVSLNEGVSRTNTEQKTSSWEYSVSVSIGTKIKAVDISVTAEQKIAMSHMMESSLSKTMEKSCTASCQKEETATSLNLYMWQWKVTGAEQCDSSTSDFCEFKIFSCFYYCTTTNVHPPTLPG
jgi:hypothetical protein